jgi:hypothetical protein
MPGGPPVEARTNDLWIKRAFERCAAFEVDQALWWRVVPRSCAGRCPTGPQRSPTSDDANRDGHYEQDRP